MSRLYLIPNVLSESPWETVLPSEVKTVCKDLKHYIVENVRTARRFLKKLDKNIDIDGLYFYELNKRTTEREKQQYLRPVLDGQDTGIISEAGCPGVADPGAEIVKSAHERGIQVVPLVGPSSILLALMASGMNGQNFAFNGYLPIKSNQRISRIKQLEKAVQAENQTQLFIETPYRNNQLVQDLLKICNNSTLLCIACDLTAEKEFISTRSIAEWKKGVPDLNKRPALFILGR